MRRYPASSSVCIFARSASMEGWIPIETPQSINVRVPPSNFQRGRFPMRASRSQRAVSRPAWAMRCPRIPRTMEAKSDAVANSLPDRLRNDKVAQNVPRRLIRFMGIVRSFARGDFTVSCVLALRCARQNLHNDNAALPSGSEAGFKRVTRRMRSSRSSTW